MAKLRWFAIISGSWMAAVWLSTASAAQERPSRSIDPHASSQFQTSHNCLACHNGLISPVGEDVSIGSSWRASMMAQSARDPYWQAAVRREILDHPEVSDVIEDECAICHMPMARLEARQAGEHGEIFSHLPIAAAEDEEDRLAADGVSCALCHQIGTERLGTQESFTGGFVVTRPANDQDSTMFGPYEIDDGRVALMRSATGVRPEQGEHIRSSELCATCHTLITQAFGPGGNVVGRLPEQVPYLEWKHSAFRETKSCQNCHMPAVEQPTPMSSVLGEPREAVGRHTFLGGNFFMLRMLNRFRDDLGVEAPAREMDASARATLRQLETETATVDITRAVVAGGRLDVDVDVRNLTGHKLPTGYPSRRVWLHLSVRDATGRRLFESGAVEQSGAIQGNDNDSAPTEVEAHYEEIRRPDEVQIYEATLVDIDGAVTTGLLHGVGFGKDNRLLPEGFDKASAEADVAVHGNATEDGDFTAGGDRVRYLVELGSGQAPFTVEVTLRYQPIAYRWAENLRSYDSMETSRFVQYYGEMSEGSSAVLAGASTIVR